MFASGTLQAWRKKSDDTRLIRKRRSRNNRMNWDQGELTIKEVSAPFYLSFSDYTTSPSSFGIIVNRPLARDTQELRIGSNKR